MKRILPILLIVSLQFTSFPGSALAQEAPAQPQVTQIGVDSTPVTPAAATQPQVVTDASSNPSAAIRQRVVLSKLKKRDYKVDEPIEVVAHNAVNTRLATTVVDDKGNNVNAWVQERIENGARIVRVLPPAKFKPGRYKLRVTDTSTGQVYEQDFTWGVLAVNTNKSIYLPKETARLAMAVLDDKGRMVCDASVELRIENAKLRIADMLSTKNRTIKINPECHSKQFTLVPDYEAFYTVSGVGTYTMTMTATTLTGTRSITDTFEVKKEVPFDIERVSATRIYPPLAYPVSLKITAQQDFTGMVTEVVPDGFEILPYASSSASQYDNTISFESVRTISQETITKEKVLGSATTLGMPFTGDFIQSADFGDHDVDPYLKEKYARYGV